MDNFIKHYFTVDTGCDLSVVTDHDGTLLTAIAEDGRSLGTRRLSAAQFANSQLLKTVIDDFAIDVKSKKTSIDE